MSIYFTVLSIHILSAGIILILIFASIYALIFNKTIIKRISYSLSISTIFQIISGSLLLVISLNQDLIYFCKSMGLYTIIILIMQLLLYKNSFNNQFPKAIFSLSTICSVVIVIGTILLVY